MKKLLKVLLIVLGVLVILVALGPTIVSTGFGRRLAAWAMQGKLGRKVSIGRLEIGYFSGTLIERLEIGQKAGFGDEPLVSLERLECGSTLLEALLGDELAEVRIDKLELTVVRLTNGRTSIDDLLEKDEDEKETAQAPPAGGGTGDAEKPPAAASAQDEAADRSTQRLSTGEQREPPPGVVVPLVISKMRLHFRDEQLKTDVTLEELDVTARYDRGLFEVTECTGKLNEGRLAMTVKVDLRQRPELFDFALKITGCKADSDLSGLGLLVPLLYNPLGKTSGTIDLDVSLSGRGFDMDNLQAHLEGRSLLEIRDLRLEGSKMLEPLLGRFGLGKVLKLGELKARSLIADGRITSSPPEGGIRASHKDEVTLVMTGTTTFDQRIDYTLKFGGTKIEKARYGKLAQDLVQPKLRGTLSKPEVAIALLGTDSELKLDDLRKLKDLFKKRRNR